MISGRRVAKICILYVLSVTFAAYGVEDTSNGDKQKPARSRPVNLFIINGEKNEVGNASVTSALKALKEKYPGHLGNVWSVQINENDSSESLETICNTWSSAISKGGATVPDLILDMTMANLGAEASSSFTAAMGIPTLSAQFGQEGDIRYWRDLNLDQKDYLIQVMPPSDLLPEAIRQLAIQMNITNAGILYDKNFVMNHKYKSLLLNVPTRHVINSLQDMIDNVKEQLSKLRDLDVVNYFLLGDENTISMLLDAGESLSFTGRKYGWFILTLDEESWPSCACENTTILFMKPEPPVVSDEKNQAEFVVRDTLQKPLITSAFYYDLTLLGISAMKSALDNGDWPLKPHHIDCNSYDETNTPTRGLDFLAKLMAVSKNMTPTYANITWGRKNGEHHADFKMIVYMVNIEKEKITSKEESGEWQAGIEVPLQVTNDKIMNNTAVTSYRVVAVQHPPFMMYNNRTGTWYGFCIDLLDAIRETVPFEYEVREVEDHEYGSLSENGSWTGMMRELIDKRADIALSSFWVMAEREKVIDFTVPFYDLVGLTIVMQKTNPTTSLFKFLTVLENEVWLCILAAYFFTSFLMWLFDRWSPYSYQNNRDKYKDDDEKREFNIRECFWFCMTSLTPQGGGEAPKNLSGRLVAATWWLFGFIIIASYTANLAAFLTVSRLEIPIETLEDLSKQYKIQYAPIANSPAYVYFQRMADIETRFYEIWKDMSLNDSLSDVERAKLAVWDYPVSDKYTKMFQAMKEAGFPADIDEALRRIRQEDQYANNEFAFIEDASTIKYLVMTNCDLTQVGEEFSRKPYAIAVQQGSPLKDQFNNAILILLNKRRLEKLKDKWWKQNPMKKNCELENNQSDGISIQNIGGVFLVIFVGIIFACFTLAFEYWYYRHRAKVSVHQVTPPKMKMAKGIKSIRFDLHPAPTHAFQKISQFRSRF
ncbi:ionotropic receptor 25a isoform X1 [Temnothorax curvispinosus]|uniref:Ionotropic receptor 25a isoform X1 n=1 Tax=Temnothorax curvispinosus TaxID=300111 RepID=A0A6J1QTH2_9HYME|nr:ionotropic receptor 25a isoform X1 [Temnothorax curvispinosus]